MSMQIRPLLPEDKPQWLPLWQGYLTFYETELAPEITEDTWARLMLASGNIFGLGAINTAGELVGFTHYLLHGGTWGPGPICYLEDLYVSEPARGTGTGRALIEALAARGREAGWQSIYWQTASSNKTAQHLYDKLATRTDWVRYEMEL
ncbi:GNAT family N-acetyltransferase [Parvibaculaceae bacterium PLY_AMNH_Bact1]|nr:GNAT family N-acetyltransferase [Parvibaculaceae bacterium PLY_AMNH_Bact1]